MNKTYRLVWNNSTASWVPVSENVSTRGKSQADVSSVGGARSAAAAALSAYQIAGLILKSALKPLVGSLVGMGAVTLAIAAAPLPTQLPVGGNVSAGSAAIAQSGATMTITQSTPRAAINWSSFNVGAQAQVNIAQPSTSSVLLNRVLDSNPSQIFGKISAPGQVFLTNPNGVYFAPGASVDVGGLVATTHSMSDADFMAGVNKFSRNGATGSVINDGNLSAGLGGYIALLAPEVRNNGVIIAQMGTVALAAGEVYELQFDANNKLSTIRVEPSTIAALVENNLAVQGPGGLIILSAQAANRLQGGVVRNTGTLEASGMVSDGGMIRITASDQISMGGTARADAAPNSTANGGTVMVISSLDNVDSQTNYFGSISARGGDLGGNGGFVETSGSHLDIGATARVSTQAPLGKTGTWLLDPFDYTIDSDAAASLATALSTSNVAVTTTANIAAYGPGPGTGNITVDSTINTIGTSTNSLTLTAEGAITTNAEIKVGTLVLTGAAGINLNSNLTTKANMTLNGNVALLKDVTLTSGISQTFTSNVASTFVVPGDVTSITAKLVGGSGGSGGADGGNLGGGNSVSGSLTAAFTVVPGSSIYIAPGSGGVGGVNSTSNTGGGAGGTNAFSLASGSVGGKAGPSGSSGGGGGGGAATILSLVEHPISSSQMLIAGGGGGGGGSGNNANCPSSCFGQNASTYQAVGTFTGQAGYNAGNQASPIQDGGGSGGGGGGLRGGLSNVSIFYTDVSEWIGRGANLGSSGAANGFATTSLSTSTIAVPNAVRLSNDAPPTATTGYATITYGGGDIVINGNVTNASARNFTVNSPSGGVYLMGNVGSGTALASLDVTGTTRIDLSGSMTTTGAQSYTGPVRLNTATNLMTTLMTTTSNGAVSLNGTVSKGSNDGDPVDANLTISSGSGAVTMAGDVGDIAAPIGALNVTTTGTTSFASPVYVSSLSKAGIGATNVTGSSIASSGNQSYAGVFQLGGVTSLTSNTGNVTIVGAISNSSTTDLTITATTGNVELDGNLAIGTNDLPTKIGNVAITSGGTVKLGASNIAPLSIYATSLSVNAQTMTAYSNSTTNFSCNGVTLAGFCLTTSSSFTLAGTGNLTGPLIGATTLTKSGAGTLILNSNNTYTGTTTVSAGTLQVGAGGTTGTLGTGAVTTNANLVFKRSGDVALSAMVSSGTAIGGTGNVTVETTGALNIDKTITLTDAASNITLLAGSATAAGTSTGGDVTLSNFVTTSSTGTITLFAGSPDTISVATLAAKMVGATSFSSITKGNSARSALTDVDTAITAGARNFYYRKVLTTPIYARVDTGSSVYGNTPVFSYHLYTTSAGNVEVTNASPTGTMVVTGAPTASSVVGTSYSLTYGSGLTLGNTAYTLSAGGAISWSVTARPVSISGITASNKVYDASTSVNLSGTASIATVNSDAITINAGSASFADKNVGTGKAVTVTGFSLSGDKAANYILSQPTGLSANITPASLTVAGVSASSKVYDSTASVSLVGAPTVSALGADAISVSGGSGSFADKNVGTGKSVTVSGYTLSGTYAGNYSLSQPTGLTASITPASIVVNGVAASNKVYDGATSATLTGTPTVSALGSDSLSVAGGVGSFADKSVGIAKSVTVSGYTLSGADAGNYTLMQPSGLSANISSLGLTITGVTASNKVYDGTTIDVLTGSPTISGTGGDILTVSGGIGSFADKNVGTGKSVTVSGYTLSGTNAANYTLTQPTGLTANITPRPLSVTGVSASNKVYDATTSDTLIGTATVSALSGDAISVSGGTANFADKNVGTGKTVTVSGYTLSGAAAGNYTLTQPTGLSANITPASLSVTGVSASNKVYDSTTTDTLTGTATVSALSGDVLSVSGGTGSFVDKNVGTGKVVTVSGYALTGAAAGNYTIAQPTGLTANITPAPLTVTGVAASNKVYDSTTNDTLTGTATVSSLGGDALSVSGGTGNFVDKNVGTAKAVTVSGYTLYGAAAGNYTLTQPTGLTANITPAPLTISGISAISKVYDTTTQVTLNGTAKLAVLGTDVVSATGGSGNFADKNVGTAKAVTVTGFALSGTDAANYSVSQPVGLTANITPAPLTIAGVSAVNKMFDGLTLATLTGTPTVTKLGNDAVSVSGSGVGNFVDKEVGNGKAVAVTNYTLTGADAANYTAVQPGGLTANITPVPVVIVIPPPPLPVAIAAPAPLVAPLAAPAPTVVESPNSKPVIVPVPTPVVPVVSGAATVAVAIATPGVIINLVRTPSAQGSGVVDVIVPAGSASSASSLVIPLPEQIIPAATSAAQTVTVTKSNGEQLPDWITYNPQTRSFDVGVAPEGAYPLQVQVTVGGQTTVIQISEAVKK